MSSKKTAGNQGPTSVEHQGSDVQGAGHASDQKASDRGGGRPGHGQSGGGKEDKSPIAIIAGQDGPQTGGNERGNPGVGG